MTTEQIEAISAISGAVVETVRDAGSLGAPSGPMFAAFATFGFTLQQYQTLMASLVETGKLQKRGHLYFAPVESTADFKERVSSEVIGQHIDGSHCYHADRCSLVVRTPTDRGYYPPARGEAA